MSFPLKGNSFLQDKYFVVKMSFHLKGNFLFYYKRIILGKKLFCYKRNSLEKSFFCHKRLILKRQTCFWYKRLILGKKVSVKGKHIFATKDLSWGKKFHLCHVLPIFGALFWIIFPKFRKHF